MGNNVVKSVLVAVLLIVLSFTVGVAAADDVKGATVLIAGVCALAVVLSVGEKAWLALLFMPYYSMINPIPISGVDGATLNNCVAILVACYWCTLRVQGKVRFEWKSLPGLDIFFFLLVALMIVAFYRRPVSVNVIEGLLGMDSEFIGGKAYMFCLISALGYIAYSVVPTPLEKMEKYVKPIIWMSVALGILTVAITFVRRGSLVINVDGDGMSERARDTAYILFSWFIVLYVYGTKKITTILTSARYLFLLLVGFLGTMLSGFRSRIAILVFMLIPISAVKRELMWFVCCAILGYAAIMVGSAAGVLTKLPFGVQRVLSVVPNVQIDANARLSAEGSTEARMITWEYALDERTGAIKNYVWGDGYGMDKEQHRRLNYVDEGVTVKGLIRTSQWHSGPISMIQRLGYVGLIIVFFMMLYLMWFAYRLMVAYRHHSLFPIIVVIVPHLYGDFVSLFGVISDYEYIFARASLRIVVFKMFYCEGVKAGIIAPVLRRKSYIPMAVQERRNEELDLPEYPLPRKLKKLQNKQA